MSEIRRREPVIRMTVILKERVWDAFKKKTIELNGGRFDPGIQSKYMNEAVEQWLTSKSGNYEGIEMDELDPSDAGDGNIY